ncbi:hypothetical protein FRC14_008221 [Serendipita sp. 396]|nr:hypothetical protein FRC14_008221 [Serendipita sp. 396]
MSEPRNQDQTEVDVVDVQQELLTEAESGTLGGEVSSSSSFPHPGEMPHPAFVVVSEADVESTGFPLKLKSKLKKMKSPKVMFVVAPALATVIRLPTRITVLRRQRTHSNQGITEFFPALSSDFDEAFIQRVFEATREMEESTYHDPHDQAHNQHESMEEEWPVMEYDSWPSRIFAAGDHFSEE